MMSFLNLLIASDIIKTIISLCVCVSVSICVFVSVYVCLCLSVCLSGQYIIATTRPPGSCVSSRNPVVSSSSLTTYCLSYRSHCLSALFLSLSLSRGSAAAVPPPFRPGDPALCGSHPLVTPYQCRLGDLLCFVCAYCIFVLQNQSAVRAIHYFAYLSDEQDTLLQTDQQLDLKFITLLFMDSGVL